MLTTFNTTNNNINKTFVLDLNILEDFLKDLYKKVISCLLELSQYTFTYIRSLVKSSKGSYSVVVRLITYNINNML
jgi:hypothetical protein